VHACMHMCYCVHKHYVQTCCPNTHIHTHTHTYKVGDMRPYLSGFFDTTSGPKASPASYKDIALSIGADSPSQLLFATGEGGADMQYV